MKAWRLRAAISLAATLAAAAGVAGAESPRRYLCRALSAGTPAPAIDGSADDTAWRGAAWSEPFVDIRGAGFAAPLFATRFRALWDERALYLLAELAEPRLFATLSAHDSVIFHDPDFELFLDPDGDGRDYFEIEINALGTTWDLSLDRPYHEGGRANDAWEADGLSVAIGLDGTLNEPRDIDVGWTVELALPWRAFSPPGGTARAPVAGESWRVNFSRVEWPLAVRDGRYGKVPGACEENWVWTAQGRIDMHRPERWGWFDFAPGAVAPEY